MRAESTGRHLGRPVRMSQEKQRLALWAYWQNRISP